MDGSKFVTAWLVLLMTIPGYVMPLRNPNFGSDVDAASRRRRDDALNGDEAERWMSNVEKKATLDEDLQLVSVESDQPASQHEFEPLVDEYEPEPEEIFEPLVEEPEPEEKFEPLVDEPEPEVYEEIITEQVDTSPPPQHLTTESGAKHRVKNKDAWSRFLESHKQEVIVAIGILVMLLLLIITSCVNCVIAINSPPKLEESKDRKSKKKKGKSKKQKPLISDASSASSEESV
ncbi:uncharacterized protein LOC121382214 [Gigantopelta aegis]|uniref:uncharacterized protein LOC121382214 n=1 Tax=Gigantopelta aegis TaxID=1735272 RepID=UPI001B88D3E7|nr:uncharacterized protein LOC121382214 [Gigantopelta aegis]